MSYRSCHDTPMQTPPTSFIAPLESTPRQLELPLNLLPLQPHVPALTLCRQFLEAHGFEYQIEEAPLKIFTGFNLPKAGLVVMGMFAEGDDTGIVLFVNFPEIVTEPLATPIARILAKFQGDPGVSGKIFPDGQVRLISRLWFPKTRTLAEIDHILTPNLNHILHEADLLFPKIARLLRTSTRPTPLDDFHLPS